jgi:hypothetical protein
LQKKLYDKFGFGNTDRQQYNRQQYITRERHNSLSYNFCLRCFYPLPFGEPCNKNNHDMPGTLRKNLPGNDMAGREKTTILEDSSLRKSRIFLGEVLAKNGSAGKIANLLHRLRIDNGRY